MNAVKHSPGALGRTEQNAARRERSREHGVAWFADHGWGRGRRAQPHTVMTTEGDAFVCETDDPRTADLIVELLAALDHCRVAFRAWKRARAAIAKARRDGAR